MTGQTEMNEKVVFTEDGTAKISPINKKEYPLNAKQTAFLFEYMRNGNNAAVAYKTIYTGVTQGTAQVNSSRLVRDPRIQALLAKERAEMKKKEWVERSFVVETLQEVIWTAREKGDLTNLNRALQELSKLMGFYEPVKTKVEGNISHEYQLLFPGVDSPGLIDKTKDTQETLDVPHEDMSDEDEEL